MGNRIKNWYETTHMLQGEHRVKHFALLSMMFSKGRQQTSPEGELVGTD